MQFSDLTLGQGDDPDGGKRQALVERGHILLVARQAVQRLGHDHVELAIARIGEQALVARSQHRGTAERSVAVGLLQGPALPFDERAALSHLVLDRGFALVVRRVPGVDHGAHGLSSWSLEAATAASRIASTTPL
jgi:hypothetical protein